MNLISHRVNGASGGGFIGYPCWLCVNIASSDQYVLPATQIKNRFHEDSACALKKAAYSRRSMENAMHRFNQAPAIEASIVRAFVWLRIKTV